MANATRSPRGHSFSHLASEIHLYIQAVTLIPPTPTNLAAFAAWSQDARHTGVYLGAHVQGLQCTHLEAGDLILVPGGWAWAVSTTKSAVAVSGDFYPASNLRMQTEVTRLERKLGLAASHAEVGHPYIWAAAGNQGDIEETATLTVMQLCG